jgi:hypothetical protein
MRRPRGWLAQRARIFDFRVAPNLRSEISDLKFEIRLRTEIA